MSSFLDSIIILSTIDDLTLILNNTISAFINIFTSVISEEPTKAAAESVSVLYHNLSDFLYFDDFQLKLLKGFIFFLIINCIFIYISWRIYGKRICDRFMKPATSKAIEELRASVSKLKLPREHSPRI